MQNRFPQLVVSLSGVIILALLYVRGRADDVRSFLNLSKYEDMKQLSGDFEKLEFGIFVVQMLCVVLIIAAAFQFKKPKKKPEGDGAGE